VRRDPLIEWWNFVCVPFFVSGAHFSDRRFFQTTKMPFFGSSHDEEGETSKDSFFLFGDSIFVGSTGHLSRASQNRHAQKWTVSWCVFFWWWCHFFPLVFLSIFPRLNQKNAIFLRATKMPPPTSPSFSLCVCFFFRQASVSFCSCLFLIYSGSWH
jgi:hypothetical protein